MQVAVISLLQDIDYNDEDIGKKKMPFAEIDRQRTQLAQFRELIDGISIKEKFNEKKKSCLFFTDGEHSKQQGNFVAVLLIFATVSDKLLNEAISRLGKIEQMLEKLDKEFVEERAQNARREEENKILRRTVQEEKEANIRRERETNERMDFLTKLVLGMSNQSLHEHQGTNSFMESSTQEDTDKSFDSTDPNLRFKKGDVNKLPANIANSVSLSQSTLSNLKKLDLNSIEEQKVNDENAIKQFRKTSGHTEITEYQQPNVLKQSSSFQEQLDQMGISTGSGFSIIG